MMIECVSSCFLLLVQICDASSKIFMSLWCFYLTEIFYACLDPWPNYSPLKYQTNKTPLRAWIPRQIIDYAHCSVPYALVKFQVFWTLFRLWKKFPFVLDTIKTSDISLCSKFFLAFSRLLWVQYFVETLFVMLGIIYW